MEGRLTKGGSYRNLKKYPSAKIAKEVKKAIDDSTLDEDLERKLTLKNTIIPRIYGLPKIHKEGVPFRSIVNTIGSATYQLAKFLAKTLKPLVGHTFSFIKYSSHFINSIKYQKLEDNDILVSFDVVSLYTKVPIEDSIRVLREITSDEIAKLVEISLKSTYFSFTGEIYEQVDGVAMGSPLSLIVANLYMEYLEKKSIDSSTLKPRD